MKLQSPEKALLLFRLKKTNKKEVNCGTSNVLAKHQIEDVAVLVIGDDRVWFTPSALPRHSGTNLQVFLPLVQPYIRQKIKHTEADVILM